MQSQPGQLQSHAGLPQAKHNVGACRNISSSNCVVGADVAADAVVDRDTIGYSMGSPLRSPSTVKSASRAVDAIAPAVACAKQIWLEW